VDGGRSKNILIFFIIGRPAIKARILARPRLPNKSHPLRRIYLGLTFVCG
jgi:hypothetical protein